MTRRDYPRFANASDGGNLPARPGLIRTVIVGGLAVVLLGYGAVFAVMAMGGV